MSSSTAKMTRGTFPIASAASAIGAFALGAVLAFGCGAPMRPLPDEVSPIPRSAQANFTDAGKIEREEAGTALAAGRRERQERCGLRIRRNGPDHVVVSRGLAGALRELRASGVVEDVDQTGAVRGLRLDTLDEGSCLGALGFAEQDVLLEINGYGLGPLLSRRQAFESVDDGEVVFAVVHFLRGGRPMEWRFDETH